MSYSVTVETTTDENGIKTTKVTAASGNVPPKIIISGHTAEPGTAPPSLSASDGTVTVHSYLNNT